MISIKALRALLAISEERSLTGAARRMNVSQPWISEQLRQIEQALGVALVVRGRGRFVRLTPAGEAAVAAGRGAVEAFDQAQDRLFELGQAFRNRLTVGAEPITLDFTNWNALIVEFMRLHPGVDLVIENASPTDLVAGLLDGRFDMILSLLPCPAPGIDILPLYGHAMKLFVPVERSGLGGIEGDVVPGDPVVTLPERYQPAFMAEVAHLAEAAGLPLERCSQANFEALLRSALFFEKAALMPDLSDCFPSYRDQVTVLPVPGALPMLARWGLMRRRGDASHPGADLWALAAADLGQREAAPAA
ncbi:LysR family transcriptional regulator [Novosphingobium bradum]|uniref:LysR family transcriptional regulator n=1 Tax=Novosphingobium bradum TaxID=1737444 RepID=A0ABV7ISC4_9SPHN